MENELEIFLLNDPKDNLSTSFMAAFEILKSLPEVSVDEEEGKVTIGKYSLKFAYIEGSPLAVKSQDVNNKCFFSSTGSALWNFVANESFYSVNFSQTNNSYFDEWAGTREDTWEQAEFIIFYSLAAMVRKWGDLDEVVLKSALFIMKMITSHNRIGNYHCDVPIVNSAYHTFMSQF